jgi:hypothetical protein
VVGVHVGQDGLDGLSGEGGHENYGSR